MSNSLVTLTPNAHGNEHLVLISIKPMAEYCPNGFSQVMPKKLGELLKWAVDRQTKIEIKCDNGCTNCPSILIERFMLKQFGASCSKCGGKMVEYESPNNELPKVNFP